eukprot:3886474-Pyramimonas_sp.AAC.1
MPEGSGDGASERVEWNDDLKATCGCYCLILTGLTGVPSAGHCMPVAAAALRVEHMQACLAGVVVQHRAPRGKLEQYGTTVCPIMVRVIRSTVGRAGNTNPLLQAKIRLLPVLLMTRRLFKTSELSLTCSSTCTQRIAADWRGEMEKECNRTEF